MSLYLYNRVMDSALRMEEKLVLVRLAFSATEDDLAILPLAKLASDTSFTEEEVKQYLGALAEQGIIEDRSLSVRSPEGMMSFSPAHQINADLLPKWTPELRKKLLEEDAS